MRTVAARQGGAAESSAGWTAGRGGAASVAAGTKDPGGRQPAPGSTEYSTRLLAEAALFQSAAEVASLRGG